MPSFGRPSSGESNPSDIAVVICSYTEERWTDIDAAIESVRCQTHKPSEIVLVIDNNDNLLARSRDHFTDIIIVANSRAQGTSGARNSGVESATAPLIAFLDDDARADPTWLEMLWRSGNDPSVAGVGGATHPVWDPAKPRWFPTEFSWVVGGSSQSLPDGGRPVRNVWGGNMMVRREVWERVGGFRDGFGCVKTSVPGGAGGEPRGSTAEDTEFCIRVSQACPGLSWIFEPAAGINHRVPPHRGTLRYFLARCWEEGVGKAHLASSVGNAKALEAELGYATRDLPVGVAKAVWSAGANRDFDGVRQAAAICAGLAAATVGFVNEWRRSLR